jgi:hypothetical protein
MAADQVRIVIVCWNVIMYRAVCPDGLQALHMALPLASTDAHQLAIQEKQYSKFPSIRRTQAESLA